MLVKWNRKHVWSIGTGSMDTSVIQFIPGPNEIKKELWDKIKNHPVIKERMELDVIDEKRGKVKMLEVIMPKADDSDDSDNGDDQDSDDQDQGSTSISSLNATDAVSLIKETYNVELLRSWQESESRAKPTKAIESQFKKIEDMRVSDEADKNSSGDSSIVE